MEFDFNFAQPQMQPETTEQQDAPMRILVLGDFSGRENRGILDAAGLSERPILLIDVDNLDSRMFQFAPRLHLPLGDPSGPGVAVGFKSLEDFHPDELFHNVEIFQALRDKRKRLADPATFAEAAAELKAAAATQPETKQQQPEAKPEEPEGEDDMDTLSRLLGGTPSSSPSPGVSGGASGTDISKFINRVVAPHVIPDQDPQQQQFLESVDQAISEQMRAVLRLPAFQRMEAAWRSINWLIDNLETSEELQVHVMDVSRPELAEDLRNAGGDLERSGLYKAIVEKGIKSSGGQPWSLLVGDYSFGLDPEDAKLLALMGAIGFKAGGPFLAQAKSEIVGCESLAKQPDPHDWTEPDEQGAQAWRALRKSGFAAWVGLAAPRVLLRLPYGEKTDEIERFEFEESPDREHDAYLWGNPAYFCAGLIGAAFERSGWAMQPGDVSEVGDLPSHTFQEDGEFAQQACGEVYLSDRAGEAIMAQGLMPILSNRGRNSVKIMRFHSLTEPPSGLSGNWR
ncbi:MAG: type VI secretion system contractile sheath large subunit [Planctomycetales bacterium]